MKNVIWRNGLDLTGIPLKRTAGEFNNFNPQIRRDAPCNVQSAEVDHWQAKRAMNAVSALRGNYPREGEWMEVLP